MATNRQIKQLSDLDLAVGLCATIEDSELFEEFTKRFRKDLDAFCQKKCKIFKLDKQIGTEICHDSLERFRAYKSYNPNEVNQSNARNGILVFLFKIATNRFFSYSKKSTRFKEDTVLKTNLDSVFDRLNSEDSVEDLVWKREVSTRIFGKLNTKEQQVIIADLDHKRHSKYLPDEITEMLSEQLGITKASIRKIRERATTKIKMAIDEINQE